MKATLEKVRGGRDATVVIVHDDGDLDTCRFLLSEYEKNRLCGTIAMVADRVVGSAGNELNTDAVGEWQKLLDSGRFSISSHSLTHTFWGLSDEDEDGLIEDGADGTPYHRVAGCITREVRDSGQILRRAFPSQRVLGFVKPGFGKHKNGVQISERAYEIIKHYYVAMCNTGGGVESIPPRDPYNIRSYMVRAGESAEDWIAYTEEAIGERGMIVYLFHKIEDSPTHLTVLKSEASRLFEHIGKRLGEGKIHVATFEEAALYAEEFRAARLAVAEEVDAVTLSLTTALDGKIYDVPLTVRIDGVEGEPRAEDGRELVEKDGSYFLEIRPEESVRLLLFNKHKK